MRKFIRFLQKTYLIQRFAEYKNIIFGVFKIITGVFTTPFIVISGIYSILTGIAIKSYLRGERDAKKPHKAKRDEHYYFARMASFILFSGLFYTAYMASLFFVPVKDTDIELLVYITAFFSALGLIIASIGLISAKTLLKRGLKAITLSTGLVSVSLAAAAIMSVNDIHVIENGSAILGVVVGALCITMAIIMLSWHFDYRKRCKKEKLKGYRRVDLSS